jgi:hypothetical protein
MRRAIRIAFLALPLLSCACDDFGPPGSTSPQPAARRATGGAPPAPKGPVVYGGKTAEQWARALRGNDREAILEACRALHVMGRDGRQHLMDGLDSANPEARRLCLETLTIADFKKLSDAGRQKLVKLSGDRDDMRIRERAVLLLGQWHGSIPAP